MPPAEKRLPGQSNAAYEQGGDPNAEFLGTGSLQGSGDDSWTLRLFRWLLSRRR